MRKRQTMLTRRAFLRAALTSGASFLLAACGLRPTENATPTPPTQLPLPQPAPTQPAPTQSAPTQSAPTQPAPSEAAQSVLPPTPACGGDDPAATPAQTEGPYYTPNSPERLSFLEPGITGTKLILTGYVLSTTCERIAGALVDFWHADDAGAYDNAGYKLRGQQFTDDQGRYTLETIVPGLYPGRTRHIHVKVQAPHQPVLTTQLYFPGEPANDTDGIFRPELLTDVQDAADGKAATFNFVLDVP